MVVAKPSRVLSSAGGHLASLLGASGLLGDGVSLPPSTSRAGVASSSQVHSASVTLSGKLDNSSNTEAIISRKRAVRLWSESGRRCCSGELGRGVKHLVREFSLCISPNRKMAGRKFFGEHIPHNKRLRIGFQRSQDVIGFGLPECP